MIALLVILALALSAPAAAAESCIASVYWIKEQGTKTASGIPLEDDKLTAAHKTLPMGTLVEVTNARTGATAVVTITDRGPFVGSRCIDLTEASARAVGIDVRGLGPVRLRVVGHRLLEPPEPRTRRGSGRGSRR